MSCARRFAFGLVILAVAAAGRVDAANPAITAISPPGGQLGTEVSVTISGSRLGDVEEVMFYEPGIEVKELAPRSASSFAARFVVADDCPLGSHAFRVRTSTGITSSVLLFSVGALPEVLEKEPNNDPSAPQKIELNTTVNGVVQTEDVDYYVVEARQGQRLTAEIEGIRLGRTFFDPYVSIIDQDGFELARSDDSVLLWHDAVASLVVPKDGSYLIQVREAAYGGSSTSLYRLHVGTFPRPTTAIPAGGRPGETVEFRLIGDPGGEIRQKVALPSDPQFFSFIFAPDNRIAPLYVRDKGGIAPSPLLIRLSDLDNVIEVEPNNELAEATPFEAPAALNGVLSEPGDVDCFKFQAKRDQQLEIRVHARSIRSSLDSVLDVYRSNGSRVANNDDSGSPDSYLRFRAPADDTYTIKVSDLLGEGGVDFGYRIEVSPVEPGVQVTIPERQRYIDTVLEVPQGSRGALLISASRQNFSGDLELSLGDLPAGVKVETIPVAANQTLVPVVISAEADAPLAGALVDVQARATDPKSGVAGHVTQTSLLVRGQNNRPVWTHTMHRMAMAVTKKLPFEIELVAPKAPLVRNGMMELKIVAQRDEGFTAPINVYLLSNPAGVSSSAAVSIAEGKTEGTIPLTANNTAALGTWKIVVMGQATVGDGPVLAASNLTDLTVADSFLNVAFKPAAVEQGREGTMLVDVTNNAPFEGTAKAELVGLPAEAKAEPVELTKETKQIAFRVLTTEKSPVGRHKGLLARVTVEINGEPVVHVLGAGELRVDRAVAASKPAAPGSAPSRPLSRLEQLRQQREQEKTTATPTPAASGQ